MNIFINKKQIKLSLTLTECNVWPDPLSSNTCLIPSLDILLNVIATFTRKLKIQRQSKLLVILQWSYLQCKEGKMYKSWKWGYTYSFNIFFSRCRISCLFCRFTDNLQTILVNIVVLPEQCQKSQRNLHFVE